jgi:hypothetical protein
VNPYEGFGWIKVPRYRDDPSRTWEERYRALEQHHIAETTFLIDKGRELGQRVAQFEGALDSDQDSRGKDS